MHRTAFILLLKMKKIKRRDGEPDQVQKQKRAPPVHLRTGGGQNRGPKTNRGRSEGAVGEARTTNSSRTDGNTVLPGGPPRPRKQGIGRGSDPLPRRAQDAPNGSVPLQNRVASGQRSRSLGTLDAVGLAAVSSVSVLSGGLSVCQKTVGPTIPVTNAVDLRQRTEVYLRRKATWLPRTEENRYSIVRAGTLFLSANDPECKEDTSWLAEVVENVWEDVGKECELGLLRTGDRKMVQARHLLYAKDSQHGYFSLYRWVPSMARTWDKFAAAGVPTDMLSVLKWAVAGVAVGGLVWGLRKGAVCFLREVDRAVEKGWVSNFTVSQPSFLDVQRYSPESLFGMAESQPLIHLPVGGKVYQKVLCSVMQGVFQGSVPGVPAFRAHL